MCRKYRRILKGKIKHFLYSIILSKKIKNYLEIVEKNPPKNVIYTCITGENYDYLNIDMFLNPKYKYICFTDNKKYLKKEHIGPWQIKPLMFNKLDNIRNNRYHKMHPHKILTEYESSLFVDANIVIKTSKVTEIADKLDKTKVIIAIPPHRKRRCIYDELDACIKANKENIEVLEKHKNFLIKERFPKNMGMTENNIIYRKNHDKKLIKIMEEWWDMVERLSKRDQLSLYYLLWKNNEKMTYLLETPLKSDRQNFKKNNHCA